VSRCGDIYKNRVSGERAVVLRGDEDSHGQSGLVHLTARPHGAVVGEHVRPLLHEAVPGYLRPARARVDGVERTLVAGQEATAPAGPLRAGGTLVRIRHRFPSGSRHWIRVSS
jgi:hypothetical protein